MKFGIQEKEREEIALHATNVVAMFLFVHRDWFDGGWAKNYGVKNEFEGRYEETFVALTQFAETGRIDPKWDHTIKYAVEKFDKEWLAEYFEVAGQ